MEIYVLAKIPFINLRLSTGREVCEGLCPALIWRYLSRKNTALFGNIGVMTLCSERFRRNLCEAGHNIENMLPQRIMTARLRNYLTSNFTAPLVEDVRNSLQIIRALGGRNIGENEFYTSSILCKLAEEIKNLSSHASVNPVKVTVVLPSYNNVVHTLVCLRSVLRQRTKRRFEIIIGDDASNDASRSVFESLSESIIYRRQTSNLGYLRNCNAAAASARGQFVVLLNNDTIVMPGWLDSLIDALEADGKIGMAGSKLLFPNGRLQEAGGIVWCDGTTSNFGRDDNPGRPIYNIVRDVDYCSGASFIVRADLWKRLRGYDELYFPAYFEDTDLAFRVRAEGFRTVFEPGSVAIHYESVTHAGSGQRKFLAVNRIKFYERWRSTLLKNHAPAEQRNSIFN